jgi:hypothetical protein
MEESIPQKSSTMSKPSSWQNNCKHKHRVGLKIIAKYFSNQSEDFLRNLFSISLQTSEKSLP